MKSVLIYSDEGVSSRSLKELLASLKNKTSLPLIRVDRNTLLPELKNASLLIMPGGRDIPYHEALKGKANQEIRSFVEEGGSYLGLCAGGYYGCKRVEFEKGGPLEVTALRELQFFKGAATGPAYGKGLFRYENENGSRMAKIHYENKIVEIYYNGGCTFDETADAEATEVLARYSDLEGMPPAIICCKIKKGLAILSGVHPEYESKDSHALFSKIIKLALQTSS